MPVKCGVNAAMYKIHNFHDHIWGKQHTTKPDLLYLAQRCVQIGKAYFFALPGVNGAWVEEHSIGSAVKQAVNTWLHGPLPGGGTIDAELIETFFSGVELQRIIVGKGKTAQREEKVGSCPHLHGRMVIPYGPRFLTYDGKTYLNVSTIDVLPGNPQHLREAKAVLRMIFRGLANCSELHPDPMTEATMIYEQIVSNNYTSLDFRFVMNWLAAIMQNPGINLQTNLWLVGSQQGVGKGTILQLMRLILGADAVGTLNQTEIEAGWNDHLFGKLLIEVNEFDSDSSKYAKSGKWWDKWIKQHTCDTESNIRQRNHTAWRTLNVGNYIFTTNDEIPTYVDKTDRRNQFIKTTDDPQWRDWASYVQTQMIIPHPQEVAAGFAHVLHLVQVNMDLLKSAYINDAKAAIQDAGMARAEEWVRNDATLVRDAWQNVRELYRQFKNWHESDFPGEHVTNRNQWSRQMKKVLGVEAAAKGTVDGKGRKRPLPEFKIGELKDSMRSDREQVAREFAPFTDEPITGIPDQAQPMPDHLSPSQAKLWKIRETLDREKKPNGHDSEPFVSDDGSDDDHAAL